MFTSFLHCLDPYSRCSERWEDKELLQQLVGATPWMLLTVSALAVAMFISHTQLLYVTLRRLRRYMNYWIGQSKRCRQLHKQGALLQRVSSGSTIFQHVKGACESVQNGTYSAAGKWKRRERSDQLSCSKF